MIIIKIIFLYFIEIAHTDDFPSTDTRLVRLILPMENTTILLTLLLLQLMLLLSPMPSLEYYSLCWSIYSPIVII